MSETGREKRPVRVTIAGQSFTLVTSGDDREVIELAQRVDDLIAGIAVKSGNVDTSRLAVLACLHLADQLQSLEQEFQALRNRMEEKARRVSGLLDQIVD
jgi:cell division protein ZapA